jgi:hypothetical protein
VLRDAGYGPAIDLAESVMPPADAEEFADHAIYVICNSGMSNVVAVRIHERCMAALMTGQPATSVFGHPGKSAAIDRIWADRKQLFDAFRASGEPLAFLQTLPWIGPVTSFHLFKNLGGDVAKPDVHLERLAVRDSTTTERLCRRLARRTGYRVATVDSILWWACANRLLNSQLYAKRGWKAAFRPTQFAANQD